MFDEAGGVFDASRCLVMIPVTASQLVALGRGVPLSGPLPAVAANAEVAETFGVEPGEDTEAAALQLADVCGLTGAYGTPDEHSPVATRQVVVANLAESQAVPVPSETANGVVALAGLGRDEVTAVFTGSCDVSVLVAAAGLDLDAAWQLPSVQAMLAQRPLSWHDRSELSGQLFELAKL